MAENQEQVLESNPGYDSAAEIFSHGENRDEINTVKITQKVLIPAHIYVRLSEKYKDKSYWAFYRHLTSGELDLTARYCVKGRKKYYFIEVDDPHIIRNAHFIMAARKVKRKVFKRIHIKVPSHLAKAVDAISTPESPEYKKFYEFVNREVNDGLANVLPIRIVPDTDPPTPKIEKRIQLEKKDYQRLLEIVEANDLSIGKVIITLLKSYLAKYELNFE